MKVTTLAFTGAVLVAHLAAPPRSAAQRIEAGGFVTAAYFDRSLGFQQAKGGVGGHLGFFVTPGIEIEGEGSWVPTEGRNGLEVKYVPLRARLLFNIPSGEHVAFLLGGGYVHNEYRGDADGSDDGATAFAGLRLGVRGLPSIRLGSYVDYIPNPTNGVGDNINWGLQAGLSFLFGRRDGSEGRGETKARPVSDSAAQAESMAMAAAETARRDSLARAQAEAAKAHAQRDSLANAARDSTRKVEEAAKAREQALRDSLTSAARDDSLRTTALRDSLRVTRGRAQRAALEDSLARVALRDSLRYLVSERETRVTLRGVNFQTGKAVLLETSKAILQDVASSLVANPAVRVEVAGHTDNTGSRAVNDRLSKERAEAVQTFLIENGVAADRMEVHGYAWDQPVASNKTKAGRAQNRRVELRRVD